MAKTKEDAALAERRNKAKKAIEAPTNRYIQLRESLKRSSTFSKDSTDAAKKDFFTLYQAEIDEFIDSFHDVDTGEKQAEYTLFGVNSHKYEVLVSDYMKIFKEKRRGSLGAETGTEEKDTRKISGVQGELQKHLEADGIKIEVSGNDREDETEKEISGSVKAGVREISKWLYRNCTRRGLGRNGTRLGDDHTKFVLNFVMVQPLRVKLLGFYLIEKKKRKNPDYLDVVASQAGYVPDLEAFKSAMTASKFKVWMRLDGSYIYWDKLSEGMRKARDNQDALREYANMGEVDPPSGADEAAVQGQEQEEQSGQEHAAQGQGTVSAPKYNRKALQDATQVRKAAFEAFIAAAAHHRELLESKEGKDRKKVDASILNLDMNFKILQEADDQVLKNGGLTYAGKTQAADQDPASKLTNDKSTTHLTGEQKFEYGKMGTSGGGSVVGGVGTAVGTLAGNAHYIHWNIGEIDRGRMFEAGGALGAIGNVATLVSGCMAIAGLAMHATEDTADEIVQKCFEVASNLADLAKSATTNAYKMKNAGDLAVNAGKAAAGATSAVKHATQATAYAGIVAGTLNAGIGFAQVAKVGNQMHNSKMGLKAVTDSGETDKNKRLAERINKGIARNQDNAATSGAAKAIGGTLQLIGGILDASLIAAPVGMVLNAIGSGITIVTSIAMHFKKKKDRKKTVDEYVGMDAPLEGITKESLMVSVQKMYCESVDHQGLDTEEAEKAKNLFKNREEEIRDEIRDEVIATMGFASLNAFYISIMDEYAEFLYAHAFYKDGVIANETMLLESEMSGSSYPKEKGYADMLRGAGVRVKYPKDRNGKPNVSVQVISKKLQG